MDLHRYFNPVQEWVDEQAVAWPQSKLTTDPPLAQRVSKAYHKIETMLEAGAPAHPKGALVPWTGPTERAKRSASRAQREIRVRAIRRPEPDAHKLARALLALAREGSRRDD